jgi:hypothetical protein
MSHHDDVWRRAVVSLGLPLGELYRPDPGRWLRYAFWGALPLRCSTWVLYDTTGPTWVVRHFVRLLVVIAVPVAALAIFLPGRLDLRLTTAFGMGGLALLMAGAFINESTERRLVLAGFRWGTGEAVRAKRAEIAQRG